MTTLTLILTQRPRDDIIINEDKQQSAMSEVDLQSEVGCFWPKSSQVDFGTSHQLQVDLGSTLRPRDAIIINEEKQQSAMSEVDLKSEVSCFLPKSSQVDLGTSHRLKVDLGSVFYQVWSDWHTKVTPRSKHKLLRTVTIS